MHQLICLKKEVFTFRSCSFSQEYSSSYIDWHINVIDLSNISNCFSNSHQHCPTKNLVKTRRWRLSRFSVYEAKKDNSNSEMIVPYVFDIILTMHSKTLRQILQDSFHFLTSSLEIASQIVKIGFKKKEILQLYKP